MKIFMMKYHRISNICLEPLEEELRFYTSKEKLDEGLKVFIPIFSKSLCYALDTDKGSLLNAHVVEFLSKGEYYEAALAFSNLIEYAREEKQAGRFAFDPEKYKLDVSVHDAE